MAVLQRRSRTIAELAQGCSKPHARHSRWCASRPWMRFSIPWSGKCGGGRTTAWRPAPYGAALRGPAFLWHAHCCTCAFLSKRLACSTPSVVTAGVTWSWVGAEASFSHTGLTPADLSRFNSTTHSKRPLAQHIFDVLPVPDMVMAVPLREIIARCSCPRHPFFVQGRLPDCASPAALWLTHKRQHRRADVVIAFLEEREWRQVSIMEGGLFPFMRER